MTTLLASLKVQCWRRYRDVVARLLKPNRESKYLRAMAELLHQAGGKVAAKSSTGTFTTGILIPYRGTVRVNFLRTRGGGTRGGII